MFSSNTQDPSSTSMAPGGTTDTDRRNTTASSSQPPPQQSSQQQQHGSTGGNMMGTSGPSRPPQQQPTRTTEPYPSQDTTWWEEAHSPHPHRTEQGYGPGPGARSGPGGLEQQQYGQYGGRSRDDKRARDNQGAVNWNKVAKIICSIFLPPIGVFLETGCDKNFAINVLLTILGYLPGIIHALYVIFTD